MAEIATTRIPFHRADIGEAEIDAVVAVLRSGWLTSGPRVREFEAAFAKFIGVEHAVAVNSATAALHLALEALGVGPGDEVIVPTMTFAASGEVVLYTGARPVLTDVDPETLTVRAEDIEPHLSPRTKAIMPVHYGGHAADMDPILALARSRGIPVIEDAAHALPTRYHGRMIGTIGDVTAFSFYATKTLTTGEGGMLTTASEEIASRARLMSLHGISRHAWNRYAAEGTWRYEILEAGFKYNLTDIAAALGLVQLGRQAELAAARGRVAAGYDLAFAPIEGIRTPVRQAGIDHSWHLYPIRLEARRLRITRDEFIERLRERGVGTSVHFIPLHLHPLYRDRFRAREADYPAATIAFGELISLPIYPGLGDDDVARVAEAVVDLVTANRL